MKNQPNKLLVKSFTLEEIYPSKKFLKDGKYHSKKITYACMYVPSQNAVLYESKDNVSIAGKLEISYNSKGYLIKQAEELSQNLKPSRNPFSISSMKEKFSEMKDFYFESRQAETIIDIIGILKQKSRLEEKVAGNQKKAHELKAQLKFPGLLKLLEKQ